MFKQMFMRAGRVFESESEKRNNVLGRLFSVKSISGPALVGVLLAASLVAPVALSVDDVSALGGAEEGEVEFVARFGAGRPLALPGLVQPGWLVSSAGVAEAVVSVGSGGGEPVVGGVSVDWDVVGSSSSEPAGSSSSISSSVRVESVVSFLVCPSGFERFSVGLGSSGWGCRRVLGEGVASFSCVEGVLRVSGGFPCVRVGG